MIYSLVNTVIPRFLIAGTGEEYVFWWAWGLMAIILIGYIAEVINELFGD